MKMTGIGVRVPLLVIGLTLMDGWELGGRLKGAGGGVWVWAITRRRRRRVASRGVAPLLGATGAGAAGSLAVLISWSAAMK